MSDGQIPRIALPIGDPNGIGPEIVLASLNAPEIGEICAPIIIGDQDVLRRHAEIRGATVEFSQGSITVDGHDYAFIDRQAMTGSEVEFGVAGPEAGSALIDYAKTGINLARKGEADAVLAAPHTELSVAKAGIAFSGYPSLLAAEMGVPEDDVFLMLLCDQFRVVNTTLHEPVVSAVQRLSIDLVCRAITATHEAMSKMNFSHPRIAVAGVNPHAGEGGLFGGEDEAIVRPAVAVSAAKGWDVSGPWPADSLFAAREYDAYVVMLHDQGHIPVKLVAPMDSSAISIGTEVIFGSVAHGSAHDIAGKGVADPSAFKNALVRMVKQFGT